MNKMRFTIESGILGKGKEHIKGIKSECSWLNLDCNVTILKSFLGKEYYVEIEGHDDGLLKMCEYVENLRNTVN